jgi:hypothetical protein
MKVYWLSRHDLSPAQLKAIKELHGEDVEVLKESVVFETIDGLANYIRSHQDGFVYAVAGAPHYLCAALSGLSFGVFENHPQKRKDGSFGLKAVYHINGGISQVWVNDDPLSDEGEPLIPIIR